MPGHPPMLVPTAPVAERALLPDDPGVALTLATDLLEGDRLMANHHRGLWGYSGTGADGAGQLSIQSTGVGAESASLVFSELIGLGVKLAVRIGTCRAVGTSLDPGSTVAVNRAGDVALDAELTARLTESASCSGAVGAADPHSSAPGDGFWDLETTALALLASQSEVRFGALLVVSASDSGALGHAEVAAATAEAGRSAGAVIG